MSALVYFLQKIFRAVDFPWKKALVLAACKKERVVDGERGKEDQVALFHLSLSGYRTI